MTVFLMEDGGTMKRLTLSNATIGAFILKKCNNQLLLSFKTLPPLQALEDPLVSLAACSKDDGRTGEGM